MRHKVFLWMGGILVLTAALRGAPNQDQAHPAPVAKSPAEVRSEAVLLRVCGQCHDWQRVTETRRTKDEWGRVIDDMITRGATGTDEEYNTVFDYVLRHNALVNVNRASAEELGTILGLTEEEAGAIVSFRTANGKFADFEALKKVNGVDPKKLDAARLAIFY